MGVQPMGWHWPCFKGPWHHLEVLNKFEQGASFLFAVGPENYVASYAYIWPSQKISLSFKQMLHSSLQALTSRLICLAQPGPYSLQITESGKGSWAHGDSRVLPLLLWSHRNQGPWEDTRVEGKEVWGREKSPCKIIYPIHKPIPEISLVQRISLW